MEVGNRIIFDQDGDIVAQLGEMSGDVTPRKSNVLLYYIDIPYGYIDYNSFEIVGVDVVNKQPILKEITSEHTPEQLYINELERIISELKGGE